MYCFNVHHRQGKHANHFIRYDPVFLSKSMTLRQKLKSVFTEILLDRYIIHVLRAYQEL